MCPCARKGHQSSMSSTLKICPTFQAFLQPSLGSSSLSLLPTAPRLQRGQCLGAQHKLLPPGQPCPNPTRPTQQLKHTMPCIIYQWFTFDPLQKERCYEYLFPYHNRVNFQSMALTWITGNRNCPSISTGLSQAE